MKPGTLCSSFYICLNNNWTEVFCQENFYYDTKTQSCQQDTKYTCWDKPICVENEQKEGTNCSSYFRCENNNWTEVFCQENFYYDTKTQSCQQDTKYNCWPKELICTKNNERKPGDKCSTYYRCENNAWVEEACQENYYYDTTTQSCRPDTTNTCWSKEDGDDKPGTGSCTEGELKANNGNCASYYECNNNAWQVMFCHENEYFNADSEECEFDVNYVCRVSKPCPGGHKNGTSVDGDDCDSFYICSNGELLLQQCPYGMFFDNQTGQCTTDTDHTCWKNLCANEKDDTFIPIPKHCDIFYRCSDGESILETCPVGDWFNPATSICEPDLEAVCYNPCAENDKVILLPHPNCNQFYWCNGKQTLVGNCTIGSFNEALGSCDPNTPCLNSICEGLPDFTILADENDKSLYYPNCDATLCETLPPYQIFPTKNNSETEFCMCVNGLALIPQWQCALRFKPLAGIRYSACLRPKPNKCSTLFAVGWPLQQQLFIVMVGMIYPTNISAQFFTEQKPGSNCSTYWVEKSCAENYYYDVKTQSCQPDIGNTCWPKSICVQYEMKPGTYCSSFYFCLNNNWTEEFCQENYYYDTTTESCRHDTKYTCWDKPICVENEQKEGTNCSSYFRCENNDWTEVFCQENYYYDTKTQSCQPDTANICWPKELICTKNNERKPGDKCSTYYRCENNAWVEEACQENYYYDTTTQSCRPDTTNTCWAKEDGDDKPGTGTCTDGEHKTNNGNCASYYECNNNAWQVMFCHENEYFNADSEECEFDVNYVCRVPKPCQTGEQYPDAQNCSAYYVCCSGICKPQYCEMGYLYNSQEDKCVEDTNDECWAQEEEEGSSDCDCPGGHKTGALVAGDDCDSFYICSNGELMLQQCPYGMYFNSATELCIMDTDHTCWKNLCANEKDDTFIPIPKHCDIFYRCSDGESTLETCPVGDLFNPATSICEPDLEAVCYNPCAENDKVILLPHPNCNQFYWCNGKQTLVGNCTTGGFNEALGFCDPNTPCLNNKCKDKPDDYTFADENNKSFLYVCLNGVAEILSTFRYKSIVHVNIFVLEYLKIVNVLRFAASKLAAKDKMVNEKILQLFTKKEEVVPVMLMPVRPLSLEEQIKFLRWDIDAMDYEEGKWKVKNKILEIDLQKAEEAKASLETSVSSQCEVIRDLHMRDEEAKMEVRSLQKKVDNERIQLMAAVEAIIMMKGEIMAMEIAMTACQSEKEDVVNLAVTLQEQVKDALRDAEVAKEELQAANLAAESCLKTLMGELRRAN
ncbi:uncharacterized protein [Musca autumnalis]|uniref:uncharacterized protein n=1 Tax=Musca autumnalis TaxID=221902 RepID=UPI003CEA1D6D